ncbi:heme-containing CO-sensing transcriptional regulator RcoM 1 [bacterium BMS3Abin05]|nr:heme-containing CO-sensing transcriptional regulator RcoM 1 [bacterium BMS3Abin05]
MNSFDIGTIILSSDYKVIGINSYAKKILNIDQSSLGKSVFSYHSQKSQSKIKSLIEKVQNRRPDLPTTMIVDVLNKVLMIDFCKIHMIDKKHSHIFSMNFIDVSRATEAHINPKNGIVNIRKFPIFYKEKIIFLNASSIYYIQSDGNYCKIVTDNHSYYLHLTLKEILRRYSGTELMRVHKSFIVNLLHIKEIRPIGGTKNIIIFDREMIKSVPVAKRKTNELKSLVTSNKIFY